MMTAIVQATPEQAPIVTALYHELIREIMTRSGIEVSSEQPDTAAKCREALASGEYVALLALNANGDAVAMLTLCESFALYANGRFGIIQEFYVHPAVRSQGVGARMIQAAVDYAKGQSWNRLEVATPPLPTFDRSFAFYARNGFEIAGGRKMKRLLR